ncbi:hypothetical protein BJ508DRAFT_359260 [Ascobolus immersus RN42]|uniref:Uncharacterized protein n=1 Tax=Ascobolus immersus RN42 TaxID=1160509 RepID=A0A3N4IGA7_ASCIM|nr:hypothetical protein BJ508DRAFT_359260 [Ascobolus immersus RN42]
MPRKINDVIERARSHLPAGSGKKSANKVIVGAGVQSAWFAGVSIDCGLEKSHSKPITRAAVSNTDEDATAALAVGGGKDTSGITTERVKVDSAIATVGVESTLTVLGVDGLEKLRTETARTPGNSADTAGDAKLALAVGSSATRDASTDGVKVLSGPVPEDGIEVQKKDNEAPASAEAAGRTRTDSGLDVGVDGNPSA